jgi:hypothetical protein
VFKNPLQKLSFCAGSPANSSGAEVVQQGYKCKSFFNIMRQVSIEISLVEINDGAKFLVRSP